ncbi:hypothetical protein SAMN05443582_108109 [Phyllobacterium sp. OV277]|nr:hypothetical protein SAMN05443582_108109 [Phyllobacterium sp. OV277]
MASRIHQRLFKRAIVRFRILSQSATKPSGSRMRNRMIRTPRTIRWLISSTPELNRSPNRKEPSRDRISGETTSRAAPKNAPRMDASPPMIMMKRIWNDRSRLKPAGSTVLKYVKAQSTPAMPIMNDEIAKATSFVFSTGTPIIRAAVSLSRTAMKFRPVCDETSL